MTREEKFWAGLITWVGLFSLALLANMFSLNSRGFFWAVWESLKFSIFIGWVPALAIGLGITRKISKDTINPKYFA